MRSQQHVKDVMRNSIKDMLIEKKQQQSTKNINILKKPLSANKTASGGQRSNMMLRRYNQDHVFNSSVGFKTDGSKFDDTQGTASPTDNNINNSTWSKLKNFQHFQ